MMRVLLPLVFYLVSPADPWAFQTPAAEQATVKKIPPTTHWTEDARKKLLTKAERGDANSQMWLATAYEQGWFGEANFAEALRWFRKSAAKGNPDAQCSLGQMYEDGEGVPQDYAQAAKWYRKAAEHVPDLGGAGQGRNNLGLLYLSGQGVSKDLVLAYMWFRLAGTESNQHDARAQMNPAQIEKAERMAADWINSHPDPQAR